MIARGVWASTVLGLTAGAIAWGIAPLLTGPAGHAGAARLDQLTMWLLGSLVGALVVGGRALRAGYPVLVELVIGFALGGTAALVAATISGFVPQVSTPFTFVALRGMSWAWCGVLTATALASVLARRRRAELLETVGIGGAGGLLAGMMFVLPGPAELWQAVAFLAFGASIGIAIDWPILRRARAVVDRAPRRGPVPGVMTLRESPLFEGGAVALGDATLSCQRERVALYPPKSGVVFNGRAVTVPVFLPTGGTLMVANQRFRIRLVRTGP